MYLFCGDTRYPKGGALDFAGNESLEELKRQFESMPSDQYTNRWAQIADESLKIIAFGQNHGGVVSWFDTYEDFVDGY